ncbi:MAG: ATP-binding protein [Candidatus Krumholzibacteriota bacterium]|nr:ATP-binding protein [Candidatus Krumholzibacteriota bacterium]
MKKSFERSIDSLESIFSFIGKFVADNDLDEAMSFNLNLIIEELFTNQVRHAAGGTDHIDISLGFNRSALRIDIEDFDVAPFDPSERNPVDTNEPIESRKSGGLGIHLVENLTDDLRFENVDGILRITATINMEDTDVRH